MTLRYTGLPLAGGFPVIAAAAAVIYLAASLTADSFGGSTFQARTNAFLAKPLFHLLQVRRFTFAWYCCLHAVRKDLAVTLNPPIQMPR
jgi:hypothetical protein